jgi:hypothetical protein
MNAQMIDSGVNQAIVISTGYGHGHSNSFDGSSEKNNPIPGLHPMSITIHDHVLVARHPVETGEVILDNKVRQPSEVTVTCIVECKHFDKVSRVLDKMLNEKNNYPFTIRTKTDDLQGYILYDIVEKQTSEKWDAVELELKFIEQLTIESSSVSVPANKSNSDTVNSGQSKTSNPSPSSSDSVRMSETLMNFM